MGIFDLDLVNRVNGINDGNVEVASDLNTAVNRIVKEANEELFNEETYKYNRNLSILNNQIVGQEYDFFL
jgi:hypothetical protein